MWAYKSGVSILLLVYNVIKHSLDNEVDHDWFKPVPGMVLIYWIAAYALQIDYVYMLGHVPTNEDPVVSIKSSSFECQA